MTEGGVAGDDGKNAGTTEENVIPAEAGIYGFLWIIDPRLRGGDKGGERR